MIIIYYELNRKKNSLHALSHKVLSFSKRRGAGNYRWLMACVQNLSMQSWRNGSTTTRELGQSSQHLRDPHTHDYRTVQLKYLITHVHSCILEYTWMIYIHIRINVYWIYMHIYLRAYFTVDAYFVSTNILYQSSALD